MEKKNVRWGYMAYAGDNYHWCPDEFIFRNNYPSLSEIKNITSEHIRIERKKYKIYIYDLTGEPLGCLYELEE